VANELFFFARQHGRWGAETEPEASRLIPSDEVELLGALAAERVKRASAEDALWNSVEPLTLLLCWAEWGEAGAAQDVVTAHIASDEGLLGFLRCFTTKDIHEAPDSVLQERMQFDLTHLADVAPLDTVRRRAEAAIGTVALPWRFFLREFLTRSSGTAAGEEGLP